MLSILGILFFTSIWTVDAQIRYTNVLQTNSGNVVGEYLYTVLKSNLYASFRGIPYASPPINNLRFQAPVQKQPWQGTLLATSDRDMCIQMNDGNVVGSEDCLYLNVYTPLHTKTSELKPVVVWIHGGAFQTGNGNSSYYGPDFLIDEDVVVVSIQYRLGPFGFLNINHPNASGNNGLKDQVMALKWIQRNIHLFLGDPNRITLMGQSAGGVSVDFLKLSPMSANLFQQTISMSASPLCLYWPFQTRTEAESQAFLLGAKLGLVSQNKDRLLRLLLNTSATEIVRKSNLLPMIPFRPSLESVDVAPNQMKFLTECSPKKYREGNYNKGSHMMGYTSNEILSFVKTLDDLVEFTTLANKIINEHTPIGVIPVVPQILSLPFNGITALTKDAMLELINHLSDLFFLTGIDKKQQYLAASNNYPVYYYRFSFKSPYSAHKSMGGIKHLDGVAHEDELPYLFYRRHVEMPLGEPEVAITRQRLVRLWTNFIKYGNPTPAFVQDPMVKVYWPDSRGNGQHLDIGYTLTVKDRPTNILVKFYQFIRLGDSSILNDCVRNIASNVINGLVSIPRTISGLLIPNFFT